MKGYLCVEGADGADKSVLAARLVARLCAYFRHPVVATAQPSRGSWGQTIRQILCHEFPNPGPERMAELFALDRLDHDDRVVLPALRAGKLVVCDRGELSSIAYQHGAGGVAFDVVRLLNSHALKPGVVLVVDASPETCAARRVARGGSAQLFEDPEVQRRVQAVYDHAGSYLPGVRVVHVSGEGTVEEAEQQAWDVVRPLVETWRAE